MLGDGRQGCTNLLTVLSDLKFSDNPSLTDHMVRMLIQKFILPRDALWLGILSGQINSKSCVASTPFIAEALTIKFSFI